MVELRLIDELLEHPRKIDLIDRKILYELMLDGRQSLSRIAHKLRISVQVLNYRLNQLQQKGIYDDFISILEISKLKRGVFRVLFRLTNANSSREKEILHFFLHHPNVFWLARTGGRWDLLVDYSTRDIGEFYALVNEAVNRFPGNLQNKEVVCFVDSFHFRRKYLIPGKKDERKIVYFGGVPKSEMVDNADLKILKSLSVQARKSYLELAKELKIAPKTVKDHLKELEKKKVIQGYSPFFHPTLLGFSCYKILLTVNNVNIEKEKKIISFGQYHPNVVFVEKVVGKWDFEYDVECNDEREFRKLMRQMQDQLSDIIQDYETITFYYDYKGNYFPWELEEFEE